ncbi:MAG: hypothetical protein GF334_09675 [Candidatus Altiarchaeales archaeon]|nr:hypothetical protein [Candidatus Altiarchaeales archaeon]
MKWEGKGAPPYGFEIDPDNSMHESEVEQIILHYITRMKKKDTLTNIAETLNSKGFETRNGKKWDRHAIRRALQSNRKAGAVLPVDFCKFRRTVPE